MIIIHLRALIEKHGWTQRDFSRMTGVRESTISDMCNNNSKMLGVSNIDAMCNALKCRISDIVEHIPDES